MAERAVARTGCRFDFAGGTLDIWPLGVLHLGARTLNVAIDVPVRVELRRRSATYRLRVGDKEFEAEDLSEFLGSKDSSLFCLIAEELELPPVEAILASASPHGGGLGASSAIGTALIAATEALLGRPESDARSRAILSRDVEARLMGLPTGLQDQFPPLMGGALEITYVAGGEQVRRLDCDLDRLGDCMTVVYTGRSHFSGATNWQVIRRRLEGDPLTIELFEKICEVSMVLGTALEAGDLQRVGELMDEEWSYRRRLAEGVSTREIENLLAAMKAAGAWGGKAGGAGGGGCVAVLHPSEARDRVATAAVEAGGQVLDARPKREGMVVETT